MKTFIYSVVFSSVLLTSAAYAALTLNVAQSAKKPVMFNLMVSAKGMSAVKLPGVMVQPGQQQTVDIRGQYGSQLSQFQGHSPMLTVSVGRQHLRLKGEPGTDHTVTYNGHHLMQ